MHRRDFITVFCGAAAVWPLVAPARGTSTLRRVAMLIEGPMDEPAAQRYIAAFRDGLAKLGWIDGDNARIEFGFAVGDLAVARAAAAELVRSPPDVLLTSSDLMARAAQLQTQKVLIVAVGPRPETLGVKDVAHPDGNMTGFPVSYQSIAGKWLELLKEVDPRLIRAAVVDGPDPLRAARSDYVSYIEQAAPTLSIKLLEMSFNNAAELERATEAFAAEPGGVLVILPSTFTSAREGLDLIRGLAEKYRLPSIYWNDSYPLDGGLMSYGVDFAEPYGRAAVYVDRILRGAKISELPIERLTKFNLVINVKTAKAIGLTIPPTLLATADEVIE